jgi:hypothetical protein
MERPPSGVVALVVVALLLSAAIAYHGYAQRYSLWESTNGAIVRMNRATGRAAICMVDTQRMILNCGPEE